MIHHVCLLLVLSVGNEGWPVLWPTLPPVIQKHESSFDEIRELNLGKEYAAPIPDSLITYKSTDIEGNEIQIILKKPEPKKELERLPGPSYAYPHQGCLMCLGNHLIQTHGQSKNYLDKIGYSKWQILHDNLHNDSSFKGVRGSNEGYIGYEAGGGIYRRGLFGRLFR